MKKRLVARAERVAAALNAIILGFAKMERYPSGAYRPLPPLPGDESFEKVMSEVNEQAVRSDRFPHVLLRAHELGLLPEALKAAGLPPLSRSPCRAAWRRARTLGRRYLQATARLLCPYCRHRKPTDTAELAERINAFSTNLRASLPVLAEAMAADARRQKDAQLERPQRQGTAEHQMPAAIP